jgi:hypothetical protein
MPQDDTRSDHAPDKKRRFWQAHIKCWGQSGQTQVAYCRANGLAVHQFTYWKKRFYRGADTGVAFVPLQLGGNLPVPVSRCSFNLFTPNGCRIEVGSGFDASALKQLMAVVNAL